ncbi:MAG: hypothetical protein WCO61_10750 [Alphaproteobacteria bacterium]
MAILAPRLQRFALGSFLFSGIAPALRAGVVFVFGVHHAAQRFSGWLSLGYSVHVLFIHLQSVLMRVQERIDDSAGVMSEDEIRAFQSLSDMLHAALRDVEKMQKRLLN